MLAICISLARMKEMPCRCLRPDNCQRRRNVCTLRRSCSLLMRHTGEMESFGVRQTTQQARVAKDGSIYHTTIDPARSSSLTTINTSQPPSSHQRLGDGPRRAISSWPGRLPRCRIWQRQMEEEARQPESTSRSKLQLQLELSSRTNSSYILYDRATGQHLSPTTSPAACAAYNWTSASDCTSAANWSMGTRSPKQLRCSI